MFIMRLPSISIAPRLRPVTRWLLVFILCGGHVRAADTLWTGPNVTFVQSSSNLVDEVIPGAVSLTRGFSQWLYNPDAGDLGPGAGTPTDTEWAFGTIDNYQALSYTTFDLIRNGDLSALLPGNPMVVHLINEDIYLSLTFSDWPMHGGFIVYTRSTPAFPTVTITQPSNNAVFAAPAVIRLSALAITGGPVTNVEFLTNGTVLGATQVAPFTLATGSLGPGTYNFTAIETSAGITATSSVVQVMVVSPTPIRIASEQIANGKLAFDYNTNPGLTYLVQLSSNLVNWTSVATNVAATNPAHFTDAITIPGPRFYRVGRLPNP
jgi:hypothetical protein